MILVQGVFYLLGVIFWIWAAALVCLWIWMIGYSILMIPIALLEGLGNIWDWAWKGRKA